MALDLDDKKMSTGQIVISTFDVDANAVRVTTVDGSSGDVVVENLLDEVTSTGPGASIEPQNSQRAFQAFGLTPSTNALLVDQGITYTAVDAGVAGNSITITLVDPAAPNSPLSINVLSTDITINLATNGGSALTTTATQLVAALALDAPSLALITASGSGASPLAALSITNLATGTDGSGTADIAVEVSLDDVNYIVAATISLVLTGDLVTDGFAMDAKWKYVRGNVTALTGTGSTVSLNVGY